MTFFETILEHPLLSAATMTAIIFAVIFITREIRCWYWKINDRVTIQNQQVNLLVEIAENQEKIIALLEKALAKEETPDTIDS